MWLVIADLRARELLLLLLNGPLLLAYFGAQGGQH